MSMPSFKEWQEKATEDFFEKEFIESLGFEVESDDGQYGKAVSTRGCRGMTVLQWNRHGAHCTYFGDPVEKYNCIFAIKKDGGTRYAFDGYVFSKENIKDLLEMTW
jgi:hypothetical protein